MGKFRSVIARQSLLAFGRIDEQSTYGTLNYLKYRYCEQSLNVVLEGLLWSTISKINRKQ